MIKKILINWLRERETIRSFQLRLAFPRNASSGMKRYKVPITKDQMRILNFCAIAGINAEEVAELIEGGECRGWEESTEN